MEGDSDLNDLYSKKVKDYDELKTHTSLMNIRHESSLDLTGKTINFKGSHLAESAHSRNQSSETKLGPKYGDKRGDLHFRVESTETKEEGVKDAGV